MNTTERLQELNDHGETACIALCEINRLVNLIPADTVDLDLVEALEELESAARNAATVARHKREQALASEALTAALAPYDPRAGR